MTTSMTRRRIIPSGGDEVDFGDVDADTDTASAVFILLLPVSLKV